jgi:hypothetical protein
MLIGKLRGGVRACVKQQRKMGNEKTMKKRRRISVLLSKTPFATNISGGDDGAVSPRSTRDARGESMAELVCSERRGVLDRIRMVRAYSTIHDPAIKASLVSLAEQLANGQSPILAFGHKLAKPRRVRKSRVLS